MKLFNFGKLFVVSLAFALLMISGCSSSEEEPPPSDGGGGGNCEDCSKYSGDGDIKECEVRNDMREGC
jgi:hypothetical protein